ncbi:MAG TPA: NFACT family protein [Atribacteraceae bacterium]|nr:NFACT family protein [Atribacteraceae bacterium]
MRTLEGLPLRFLVEELTPLCLGSRIQRIVTGDHRETRLQLSKKDLAGWLVLACHPEKCALFFDPERSSRQKNTHSGWEQLLAKYLGGGRIESIEQVGWDRIVRLTVRNHSLWGEHTAFSLILELTGRNANCILTLPDEQQTVLGALRTVSNQESRFRNITPGEPYQLPPQKRERINPLDFTNQSPAGALPVPRAEEIPDWLIKTVDGIGPCLARWIAERMKREPDATLSQIQAILWEFVHPLQERTYQVALLRDPHSKRPLSLTWADSSAAPPPEAGIYWSFNEAVRALQKTESEWQTRETEKNRFQRYIRKELDYIHREEEKVHSLLLPEEEVKNLKLKGELLKIHSNLKSENLHELRVSNLLSEQREEVVIELDPRFTISHNMQRYFRRYRKAVLRNIQLKGKLEKIQKKKSLIRTSLHTGFIEGTSLAGTATPSDDRSIGGRAQRFRTPLGNEILVGKNNRENHVLINRLANRNDYWFHVRDLPGSHVILKIVNFQFNPESDLLHAARLAASLSSAKNSSRAEVIMTRVKHVRFVPSGNLGKVTFRNERTLVVEPTRPRELVLLDNHS